MTKAEIIQWIKDYKRPIDDVNEFAKQLGEKIKTMNLKLNEKVLSERELPIYNIYRNVNIKYKDRRKKEWLIRDYLRLCS